MFLFDIFIAIVISHKDRGENDEDIRTWACLWIGRYKLSNVNTSCVKFFNNNFSSNSFFARKILKNEIKLAQDV